MMISVVIATYKRPQLLQRCLGSLVQQQISNARYEIIVVSDGADPLTEKVITTLNSSLVHYYALPVKKGPAAARNLGWQQALGSLVAFTDDDTIPAGNWLQSICNAYSKQTLIAYSGRLVVPINDKPTDYELNTAQLEKADFITANCVCTKAALQAVGGFDERFATAWREDSDLEFKLLQAGIPVVHLPEAIVVHPVRKASWGVSLKEQRKSMYNALLYKKFPLLYRKKIQQKPVWLYYAMIAACVVSMAAFIGNAYPVGYVSLAVWMLLTALFAWRRLQHTSRAFTHVSEMAVTSLLIPFLSVYWTLYGAHKFRVLFF